MLAGRPTLRLSEGAAMKHLSLAACLFWLTGVFAANAQIASSDLPAVTKAVNEMCLHPDRKGSYLKVEGEIDAGVIVKVVGAELAGSVSHESWDGISQRLDQYATDPRECAVQILQILIPNFRPAPIEERASPSAVRATLEEIIVELRDETIDRARYSQVLALEIERQRAFIFPALKAAGPLEDLRFLSSNQNDTGKRIDQFIAYHNAARFLWSISLEDNAIVDLLFVQPAN